MRVQIHRRLKQIEIISKPAPTIIDAEIMTFITIHNKSVTFPILIIAKIEYRAGEVDFVPYHLFPDFH